MYNQNILSRRDFMKITALATAGAASVISSREAVAQDKGQRPMQSTAVTVLNPQNRIPLSFIIDDSTCLVNMAHFGIPHFATAMPDKYKQDWMSDCRKLYGIFAYNKKTLAGCLYIAKKFLKDCKNALLPGESDDASSTGA